MTIRFDLPPTGYASSIDGDQWNRRYHAEDMAGPLEPDVIAQVYAELPGAGTPGPAPLDTVYVRSASVDEIAPQGDTGLFQAWGTVLYRTLGRTAKVPDADGPGTIRSVQAAIVSTRVDRDAADSPIETSYDNVTMAHEVEGFELLTTYTFTRLEDADPTKNGRVDFIGKVNAGLWNGFADKTALMVGVDGDQEEDNPGSFTVVYSWQHRPSGWAVAVTHEDPFYPGKPLPLSEQDANSRKTIERVPATSFAPLNISW